ncbi:MAG: YceD family protein [Acutalibacteraceae bacterium]
MFLSLENVFNGGVESLDVDYSFDFSTEKYNGVFPFMTPVKLIGKITNNAGLVEINAVASFDFSAPCDRCAAETKKHFEVEIKHGLVASLNNDDNDDYIIAENMQLEIDRLTLEDIYLFLPSKYLCKDDCKGLCPKCGANLNEKSCSCKKETDPRLEVLLSLLDNQS